MTHTILRGGMAVVLGVLLAPSTLLAADDEIHYQSIDTLFGGNTIIVVDKGPGGEEYYACKTDGSCDNIDDGTARSLASIQAIMGSVSSQGRYGALEIPAAGAAAIALIDFSDGFSLAGTLTPTGTVIKQAFSPDEKTFILITNDGTVTAYDIAARQARTITIPQTDLPFFSVSYGGSYISAYNYVANVHRIWNTRTGALTEIPGAESYVEFNESETAAAFVVERNSQRNLSVAEGFTIGSPTVRSVAHGRFTVEDYLYVGDELFYMANKRSPLTWSIYRYGTDNPIVADGASYGDYIKRVDGKLAYLKIEGKNANVYLFDPATSRHTRLDAAPQSEAEANITREEVEIAGLTAAHLAPKNGEGKNLFVWLHGGPQRQTSLGYHPYLSYAVYDELVEKIAASGNHVLKLDYSGSYGYGKAFLDRLQGRVGTVEIDDVKRAIDEFTREHEVENIYLIGNSYGGYMAFRALNDHHDTIDGIISINGVADWYGLIATIPSSPFSRLFNGSPDLHNLALYHSASVFTNVNEINSSIPMLVFYGTEDRTVPTNQSLQYDEFMRANGKNVTLVAFEGEEHVLRKRSTLTELCETINDELSLEVACR